MEKKVVKLNEERLKQIVKESVEEVMNFAGQDALSEVSEWTNLMREVKNTFQMEERDFNRYHVKLRVALNELFMKIKKEIGAV